MIKNCFHPTLLWDTNKISLFILGTSSRQKSVVRERRSKKNYRKSFLLFLWEHLFSVGSQNNNFWCHKTESYAWLLKYMCDNFVDRTFLCSVRLTGEIQVWFLLGRKMSFILIKFYGHKLSFAWEKINKRLLCFKM